jgi:hypothetical protein
MIFFKTNGTEVSVIVNFAHSIEFPFKSMSVTFSIVFAVVIASFLIDLYSALVN